jgi:transposase-like protein
MTSNDAAFPLSDEEKAEIVAMRLAKRSVKEIANWIGCTTGQVTTTWTNSAEYKQMRAEATTPKANTPLKQEAYEAAKQIREQPAEPFKPGPIQWEPQ